MRDKEATTKRPIISGEVERIPIDTLKPHPANPRQGNVGAIIESIKHNGFYGCIVAQTSSNRIIVGHHKWEAARQLGLQIVPVMFLDVDDEQAIKILLADNKTSDEATYDDEKLVEALRAVIDDCGSLEGTGFDEDELEDLVANLETETVDFEAKKKNQLQIVIECKSQAELRRHFKKVTQLGMRARIEE